MKRRIVQVVGKPVPVSQRGEIESLVWNGVSVLDLKQKWRWIGGMAGDRVGRRFKGPRHPTMVRFPIDHYRRYAEQAADLKIPVGDYVAVRIAICDGLEIPGEVLMAHPGLLTLLPGDQRTAALKQYVGLAARYEALVRAQKSQTKQMELKVA